jgi:hypothetical protein
MTAIFRVRWGWCLANTFLFTEFYGEFGALEFYRELRAHGTDCRISAGDEDGEYDSDGYARPTGTGLTEIQETMVEEVT